MVSLRKILDLWRNSFTVQCSAACVCVCSAYICNVLVAFFSLDFLLVFASSLSPLHHCIVHTHKPTRMPFSNRSPYQTSKVNVLIIWLNGKNKQSAHTHTQLVVYVGFELLYRFIPMNFITTFLWSLMCVRLCLCVCVCLYRYVRAHSYNINVCLVATLFL